MAEVGGEIVFPFTNFYAPHLSGHSSKSVVAEGASQQNVLRKFS